MFSFVNFYEVFTYDQTKKLPLLSIYTSKIFYNLCIQTDSMSTDSLFIDSSTSKESLLSLEYLAMRYIFIINFIEIKQKIKIHNNTQILDIYINYIFLFSSLQISSLTLFLSIQSFNFTAHSEVKARINFLIINVFYTIHPLFFRRNFYNSSFIN